MTSRSLRLIGYWDGPTVAGQGWPDVRDFVDPDLTSARRQVLVDYLRSGTAYVAAGGYSACRFCGAQNGSGELTDGATFVWPEGLAHYVEAHDVGLPADVVAVAEQSPAGAVDPDQRTLALLETGEITVDEQWWRDLRQTREATT